jgi:hypothetical protein
MAKRKREGADQEEIRELKPSNRNLYYIIPRGSKKLEEKVMLWDVSQFNFQKLLNDELKENSDYEVFPDPDEGLLLKIRFEEQTIGSNSFFKTTRIDFSERDYMIEEKVYDQLPALETCLRILSYKEIEAKLFELDEPLPSETEEEKEEVIPEPVTKTRKSKRIKPSEEEPEPEEKSSDFENVEIGQSVIHDRYGECEIMALNRKECTCTLGEGEKLGNRRKTGVSLYDLTFKVPEKKKKEEKKAKEPSDNPCPFGHRFGVDTDETDDCENCDVWNDCIDEKEENEG